MDTPILNKQLRKGAKKEPVDQELRELRGFAVDIKQPMKPGDAVRQIADLADGAESHHSQLPTISGHASGTGPGGMQATFGSGLNHQQYGNQGMLAVNPYDKSMHGVPYGTMQSMKDQYDHMGSYRGNQLFRASPRFAQINRTVGEFISLQSRLNQDQTNMMLQSQIPQEALTQEQQLQILKEKYMQANQANNNIGQRDANSIQDPFETINETQTNSITDDWQSNNQANQFMTVPVPNADLRTNSRNQRTARTVVGRNARSRGEHQSQAGGQIQLPDTGERAHKRRISQEVSQRSGRVQDNLGQPHIPQDPNSMMALRANPNTKRFQNFMSKVITSVRTRTINNKLDQSDRMDQSQQIMAQLPESQRDSHQIVNEFLHTRAHGEGSMMLSGQSSGIVGSELQNIHSSLTPGNIRASARREMIGMSGQKSSQNEIMMSRTGQQARAKTNSQSGFQLMSAMQPSAATQMPRAAEQVAYLLKQVQRNKETVFIPLEAYTASTRATTKEATILKESKHPDRVEFGNFVFSQQGFVKLGTKDNPTTDFISKEKYIQDGVDFMVISKVPFFKKFMAMKTFKRWWYTARARVYERNRKKLAENFIFARPIMVERFKPVVERINKARFLNFLEIKPGVTYGKLQQLNLEQRCEQCCKDSKQSLQNILTDIKQLLVALKEEIELDDKNYIKAIKHAEVEKMLKSKSNHQAVVMFSKERKEHEHVQSQLALSIARQGLYNKLVQFISRYLTANLDEMLYTNKSEFQRVFCSRESNTQFEVSLCFNKAGKLDSDPSVTEHIDNFNHIFQSMEDSIFKNSILSFFLQDLPELFFTHPQIQVNHMAQIFMRRIVSEMEKTMAENVEYQHFGISIFNQLDQDIEQLKEQLEIYADVQEVYDFTQEWNKGQSGRQLSLNMGFYNETFEKVSYFNQIIAKVPSNNTKLGTINLETMTIKKQLTEMPLQIMNSIRHNVTQTMDNETQKLKEDLTKIDDILQQTPTSLNVYVEQVNTLKFVKQKMPEFASKYDIIHRLRKQCLDDNIKIKADIENSIQSVQVLYNNLGKLQMKAKEGLQKNKESMEKIMKGSSSALSKKIKAFERKYVENYLQDQSRLEDCSVTLEELFKRSTAIHEIKSKVMLYKEFLKLLYEDDPHAEEKLKNNKLSCAEDCDFLQDVHKHTIRLWQNLLFWKKRKRMCYETPFLKLDLNMIQRSINKIMTYFEVRLPTNDFVHKMCQPLTKQIEKQVKETSVIVDFAKELHKESLQRRHWVQFFTLIKAQHLKNSTTFTIIDLSEYKIQNYSEDIKLIINHAFTESRYENVFKSIKSEWEKADLRILPFKDSQKDYVIANTDILSDSIEESLGTLETLHKSDYAAHVRKEIEDLISILKQMLEHLDKWIQAQKYWITLDPIYNSGLFENIFGQHQRDFLETRAQFRRIMWSSFRNPQAMYNLLIKERMKVFARLTEYYLVLQQKTHEYLEQKRLVFNRFFFLNDSQFLDFLMLANSNQDFSVYVNIIFQGAHNLFISQIKPSEHVKMVVRADDLGQNAQIDNDTDSLQSEEESDVEAQLEAFMAQAITNKDGGGAMNIRESQQSADDLPKIMETTTKALPMPEIDVFKDQNEFDPVFRVVKKNVKRKRIENVDMSLKSPERVVDSSEVESVSVDDSSLQDKTDRPGNIISEESLEHSEETDDDQQVDKLVKLQHSYILGLLSRNRELFLFDRQVKIGKKIETWLSACEDAMRVSVKKHMKNAILRFPNQPIEEWIGDYPQQVAISVIHLVISQEITDTLAHADFDAPVDQNTADNQHLFMEEKVIIGKPDPSAPKGLANAESAVSAKSKNSTTSQKGERSSQERSTKGIRAKNPTDMLEDYQQKVLKFKEDYPEPPLEDEVLRANFLDDAFGENCRVEPYQDAALTALKREETRMNRQSLQTKLASMNQTKKIHWKEEILQCLQAKGLHALWMRIAFWINKCIQMLHKPRQERYDKPVMNFELLGVQKMQIKSVILFLKYQQDMIDRLIESKVTEVNDFEWQSKFRTNWSPEDEAIVQCGGWSMKMGYEYLGTYNRLAISPLTERYFVFISSSLREKSSVMFQCIPEHQFAATVVEEMASLCSVPFKTINCSEHTNLATLTQLLNGVAMSQVWVFLEFMDRLPLIGLSILLKEIQLIHQQFVVSQYATAVEEDRIKQEGLPQDEDLEQILTRKPTINIGIFGSIQHLLPIQKPQLCDQLLKQVRTSFRVINLAKPDMIHLFKSYLFMEKFNLPDETSELLKGFFDEFEKIKDERLYKDGLEKTDVGEELSLANLRTALKLSQLLKDQELKAFQATQIKKDTEQYRVKSTLDKFQVISEQDESQTGNRGWTRRTKDRKAYEDERNEWGRKKIHYDTTKLQIELDSLKEGFRVVVKSKVLKEWRAARFELYRKKQLAMVPDIDEEMINTQTIEAEIDAAILSAYEKIAGQMRTKIQQKLQSGRQDNQKGRKGKVMRKETTQLAVIEDDEQEGDGGEISPDRKHRQKRTMQRQQSIMNYKPSTTQLTPVLRAGARRMLRQPTMRHSTTVELVHNRERESNEELFRETIEKTILKVAEELKLEANQQQVYNSIGIIETMRRNKGIVVTGPQCSGKTQIVKIVTIALKRAFNVTLRSTFLTPSTFSEAELFGPKKAFQNSQELEPEQNAIRKSVFDIILDNYNREKGDLRPTEANRLVQSIYIDSSQIDEELGDSVSSFLRDTNVRERDYHKDTEFILSFSPDAKQVQQVQVMHTPMRFPNGNVIMMPSDLFFFFECLTLENISPVFLANVGIVNTQVTDVTPQNLFTRQLQLVEKKHAAFIQEFNVDMEHFRQCAEKFVIHFVHKLNEQPLIQQWPLWNMKALTCQFFIILNAFLYRLEDNCKLNLRNEDPLDYPFDETQKDIIWNIMLVATTWSFGAVLDKELRRNFEEKFNAYRSMFNLSFAMPLKPGVKKPTMFETFFDVERLTWSLIGEKLDYKIKVHFNADLNQCILPTNEISQAYFVSDYLINSLGREKDLNKNLRLIGPQSSSKTVILNTFEKKLPQAMATVTIPMTAYLTMERMRQKIEEKYICKRKNTLVPADSSKRIVLVIDDIHLQRNLKIEVLEFIRAWTTCRGYFDVAAGFFKKVGEFGTIMAENSDYVATSAKKDRFAFQTTTLYCEEISIENSKTFIQTWFTTDSWPTSSLITKYYILITNALDTLLKAIKKSDATFSHSSLSSIHKFQYIANFCSNVVNSTVNTEKEDVFNDPQPSRRKKDKNREEDALADIFCYEAMRCFGDRIMRPTPRTAFIRKLVDICQKEFLCQSTQDRAYDEVYIDRLIMGDYHVREAKAHIKMCNITNEPHRSKAIIEIHNKVSALTGNQLLLTLLDMPTGLNDLYRISRIFFKDGKHLALVGLAGSGKHELLQLSSILNDVVILEMNVPCFGQPLKFVHAFKNALKSVAKLNQPCMLQISETQLRDPIYYDYVYTFMSSIVRMDECVLFDEEFKAELAEIEAQYIRKLKKVTVPDEATCFKQAVDKIKKMLHIVFLFSDLMSYKETFQLFPQLEYLCEVIFLDDMNSKGYIETAKSFLQRSNISKNIEQGVVLSASLYQIHDHVLQLVLNSFYSGKMKENISWEHGPKYGRCQFVFPDKDKLTGNIFAGTGGFTVVDSTFRQTLFNMPMELGYIGKHRFAMYLEVFRFVYDLLNMHMQIRKVYYETYIKKSEQFLEFYKEVKAGKQYLHDEQTTKKLIFAQNTKNIEETQRQLKEKEDSIGIKEAEIDELNEELEIAKNEIDEVIKEKDFKLTQNLDKLINISSNDFNYFIVTEWQAFSEPERDLLEILAVVEQVDKKPQHRIEYTKNNFDLLFYHEKKDELQNMLSERRRHEFDEESFTALNKFIKKQGYTAYNAEKKAGAQLTTVLYDYFKELYYKLNVKNTMATTYFRIQEIKMQIGSNIFAVNYAKQSIKVKEEELENLYLQQIEHKKIAHELSRQIEEAQISHMRTEAIEEHIWQYEARITKKLQNINNRLKTLLGDSLLLAASVVYLGPFAPEEREEVRKNIQEAFEKQKIPISFNELWKIFKPQKRDTKPQRSIFWYVLKDIGMKEILSMDNLPAVLSPNDLAEYLFTILFAPSCPVIADPTGQMQEFVQRTFMQNMHSPVISASDIFGNEKVENAIKYGRMALVNDLNCMRQMSTGLSQDSPLMKRLAVTLYNGFDFHDFRTAQMNKINSIQSFFTHQTSVNKRVHCFDEKLENISLYQIQVFQPKFSFQLNAEFLQNATFVSAAPSHQADCILENNPAIIELKEVFLRNFLIDTSEFEQVKAKLKRINERMWGLESNFENSFLIASSETLKKLVDYKQLMQAVIDVNSEKDAKKRYQERYQQIMEQVNLLTEVSKVIFQIFMALKHTSKIMNETTYSWKQFTSIVEKIIVNVISKAKVKKAGRATEGFGEDDQSDQTLMRRKQSEIELEIDNEFFSKQVIPVIHKVMMSNVKLESKSFFNFVLALRFALLYNSISIDEHQLILNQLILLKDFWKWRDGSHQFIDVNDQVNKLMVKDIRGLFFKIYPEALIRKLFDHINQLGPSYTYRQLSIELQTKIKANFGLSQVQMITFGFMCPDHEFQARMVGFMYQQLQSTFDFEEDPMSLKTMIKVADWNKPISLFSTASINPINLVTSIAKHYGIPLTILRTDPVISASQASENLEKSDLRDMINTQLLDLANMRYEKRAELDAARFENLACMNIREPNKNQIIAKQNWRALKERNVNLDESSIVREKINLHSAEELPVTKICECARTGHWVLICPVQFPQYFIKLSQTLKSMEDEISPNFRLIIDFQGFTQNEIPDSLISDESITMHIDDTNVDAMPSFGDIWTKILDDSYLRILTDQTVGQQPIRNIDYQSHSDFNTTENVRAKNMKSIYEKSANNPVLTDQFHQFLDTQKQAFDQQLEAQQKQTKARLEAERKRAKEEEEARILAQKLLEQEQQLEQVNEAAEEDLDEAAISNYDEAPVEYQADAVAADQEQEMAVTEQTRSMKKAAQGESYENLIRHEQDSGDMTMSRIPVSSRGTDALEEDKIDGEESKGSQNLSAYVAENKTMKRQMTMEQEQDNKSLEMPNQQDREDRISMPDAKKRINSDFIEPQPRSTGGPMMVVGQGYSQKQNSDPNADTAAHQQQQI